MRTGRRETALERASRRWGLWEPVKVRHDAEFGEDVAMSALSRWQYEYLAAYGPLAEGEQIPPERLDGPKPDVVLLPVNMPAREFTFVPESAPSLLGLRR